MSTNSDSSDFLIKRDALSEVKFAHGQIPTAADLEADQVLVKIDAFAFTANNVSYALLGDALKYWAFFPGPEGYGRLPVWGFADVVHSNHEEVKPGERIFGYLPISSHLVMQAGKASEQNFQDVSPHRVKLPALYNTYTRVAQDPAYDAAFEAEHMLLSPLFGTSFLLKSFLSSNKFFDATAVIFTSASAKTAFATARQTKDEASKAGIQLIGLTSAGNIDFVKGLGCYDQVLSYDEITTLDNTIPSMLMDFAGNSKLLETFHEHIAEKITYSCRIGSTHPEKQTVTEDLPGPKPVVFFAPSQARKTMKEVGAREFQEQYARAWKDFRKDAGQWITPTRDQGEEAVRRVYLDMLAGKAEPDKGYILAL